MGAADPGVERENESENREEDVTMDAAQVNDIEKGKVGVNEGEQGSQPNSQNDDFHFSRLQRLNPTNPLRLVMNGAFRAPRAPRASRAPAPVPAPAPAPAPPPPPPLSIPTPQQSLTTLNSRAYTNRISLFLFLLHMIVAIGLVGFLIFKGIQGLLNSGATQRKEKRVLQYFLPQIEAASFLSITVAFLWQKALRDWPRFMVHFILWSCFLMSLAAGILLFCFQKPTTDVVGVAFIAFSIGNGLYACWVTNRIKFCTKLMVKSLEPVSKFPDLNQPTYWMLGVGFIWMSIWILAVVGALNFYFPPLIIIALLLSLLWTTEVMRNVVNLTVSRVIALYYLRGVQSTTQFCFQRALSRNLGSACLGSLFVPAIEALRIIARGLNLLEGEDEFMFSCAHCCLRVMQSVFRHGNGWAFVQIAAYGKGFVKASQDTWALFERQEMEAIVDSDITSSICFLAGVCSGSICVILVAAWTASLHKGFTATVSVLAFFIGYLMTRIAMALPHACVSCYYVCYAEHPENRLFDKTIPDRLNLIKLGRDMVATTPRVPHRFNQ